MQALKDTIGDQRKELQSLRQDVRKLTDALAVALRAPKPFFGSVPDAEGIITGRKSVETLASELEKRYGAS